MRCDYLSGEGIVISTTHAVELVALKSRRYRDEFVKYDGRTYQQGAFLDRDSVPNINIIADGY